MHACVECQAAAAEKEVVGLTANQAAEEHDTSVEYANLHRNDFICATFWESVNVVWWTYGRISCPGVSARRGVSHSGHRTSGWSMCGP